MSEHPNHLYASLAYLRQFELFSPEYKAVDGLITELIENNVYTYADQYEFEQYIKDTDAQRNAQKGATQ
ncbi:hypothetical protein ACH47B_13425 [Rhodococcus sp. NPDC019627]|uniref:hypothetical protein n=1 Tax=unclassified Rhodococcus (in: high G+C Gram-positive bacteria) TaxID=192944 RepID=UPI0033DE7793